MKRKLLTALLSVFIVVMMCMSTLLLTACGEKDPAPTPSTAPSAAPSTTPTAQPTVNPTVNPTVAPTPTVQPTVVPSVIPSVVPSVIPSVVPSVIPSVVPSVIPSVAPSIAPSVLPTTAPTTLPTVAPTTPNDGKVEVRVSGGTINDNKTMIGRYAPGQTVRIKAQTRLNAQGNADTFVKWVDDQNTQLANTKDFSYTVPNEADGVVTLIGEWSWYGKAAPNAVANDKLVAYIEYNRSSGIQDNVVRAYIEKKFKDDMGYNITLDFKAQTNSTLGTVVAGDLAANEQVDILSNHWGTDSPIDSYLKSALMTQSVAGVLEKAPNFREAYYEYDPDAVAYYAGFYSTDRNFNVYEDLKGISSVNNPAKWGMLMNGTILDKLYAASRNNPTYKTMYDETFPVEEFDPEVPLSSYFDVSTGDYKHMTLTQFTNALLMSKNLISSVERPLNAAGWCIDYLISPLFGGTGYNGVEYADVNGDGKYEIIPAYATTGYLKVLQYERYLQTERLWYEDPNKADSTHFFSGKNLVMISWPDITDLMRDAKRLKASTGNNAIVLAPLAADGYMGSYGTEEDPVVVGNAAQSAYMGNVLFAKSTQADLYARYLDWMYMKDENGNYSNYELTVYGVEGVHWNKGEVEINGETYTSWQYTDEFLTDAVLDSVTIVYSKKYCIISNDFLANYVWEQYTETERAIFVEMQNFDYTTGPEIEIEGWQYGGTNFNPTDGFNMPDISNMTEFIELSSSMGNLYQDIRGYAWSPKAIAGGKTLLDLCNEMKTKLLKYKDEGGYRELIDYYTEAFETFHEYRMYDADRIGE